jgi:hypothetical protein
MDLGWLRPWLILIHVLSVVAFALVHGISAGVGFKLRTEREPARIRALLELSNAYLGTMYAALVLILVSGILAGIVGGWWTSGRLWIWVALGVFVAVGVAMYPLGVQHFDRLRGAVGLQTYAQKRSGGPPPDPASPAELELLLQSSRPVTVAAIGIGGLAILVWLMVLKPF